jgi:AcrR family transcriptional regulator
MAEKHTLPATAQSAPDDTRGNILDVATEEFSRHGLAGARIDAIAAKTLTSKRMIYYHFRDKEQLYLSCLERAYEVVRAGEQRLSVTGLSPLVALETITAFTFDHHWNSTNFVRMVMIENIHNADYLKRSTAIANLNRTAIEQISDVYERGVASGLFRPGLDPVLVHWQISALCFYNVSNQATFSQVFGRNMSAPDIQAQLRKNVIESVLLFVRRDTTS